jgi:hypothetical protein
VAAGVVAQGLAQGLPQKLLETFFSFCLGRSAHLSG